MKPKVFRTKARDYLLIVAVVVGTLAVVFLVMFGAKAMVEDVGYHILHG